VVSSFESPEPSGSGSVVTPESWKARGVSGLQGAEVAPRVTLQSSLANVGVSHIVRADKQVEQTMRQKAEQLPYVGSAAVRSRRGPSPACRSIGHRSGFTLIEVVVAMAILLIVVLALVSSYSFYYGRTVQLRVATIGQNLAQLDLEDIRSYSKSELYSLCQGNGIYPNYRAETPSDPGGPSSEVYDVGKVAGTFYIPNITAVLGHPPAEWNGISSSIDLPPGVIDLAPAGPSYVDYTMVLMESVFPGYQRRVVITELTPVDGKVDNNTFRIDVTVYWTFAGKTRSYTVSTEK